MADYHFTTYWTFDAPIEKVWAAIKAVAEWPEWWPYVQQVELLQEGTDGDIGSIRRMSWKTALPYSFSFDSELIALEKHRLIEGRSIGDLEGKGIWTFSVENGVTRVRYDWIVKTKKQWMNILAPIARPLFEWNHSKVMAAGYAGLKKKLAESNEDNA